MAVMKKRLTSYVDAERVHQSPEAVLEQLHTSSSSAGSHLLGLPRYSSHVVPRGGSIRPFSSAAELYKRDSSLATGSPGRRQ